MTLPLGTVVVIIASSVAMAWEVLQRHNAVLSCRNPPDAWHDMGHAANSVFLLTPHRNPQVACAADDRRRAPAVTQGLDGDALRPLLWDAVLGMLRHVSDLAASGATRRSRP